MKKKITFITTGDIKNIATAKRALGMANYLSNLDYAVSILMEDTVENRKRAKLECDERTEMFFYPSSTAIKEIWAKKKILSHIKPDFIYVCAFVFRNIPLLSRSKSLILTEHSELQSEINEVVGFKKLRYMIMENLSVIMSDGLLQASKYLESNYKKRFSKARKLPTLYFPYAFSSEQLKRVDMHTLPSHFLPFKETFNFIFLGRLVRNYGLFTMLEAFESIFRMNPKIRLIILGNGEELDEARRFVKEKGMSTQVVMPGYIEEEDIARYFSIANVFISPMNDTIQDWARCPSKLYMYLPYERPIITCKIGETFETLQNEGYYYESGNKNSLAQKMLEVSTEVNPHYFKDFNKHSWKARTEEFVNWLRDNFKD